MYPWPGNWVAVGSVVVNYARAAHASSAEIKCRHCTYTRSILVCYLSFNASWKYNPMLLVAYFANTNRWKNWKIFETISHRYPAKCTQRELSNEYLHDRVKMGFRVFCAVVPWKKVTSALEGFGTLMEKLCVGELDTVAVPSGMFVKLIM